MAMVNLKGLYSYPDERPFYIPWVALPPSMYFRRRIMEQQEERRIIKKLKEDQEKKKNTITIAGQVWPILHVKRNPHPLIDGLE